MLYNYKIRPTNCGADCFYLLALLLFALAFTLRTLAIIMFIMTAFHTFVVLAVVHMCRFKFILN